MEDPVSNGNEEARSIVADEGEWKTRKIRIFKVFGGFIRQLKPGQDLTKVSLPAEMCHPYTMLEVMGLREIINFHFLFDINQHPDDPLKRFMVVLKNFLAKIRQETFEKKPFNSVLGETHVTYANEGENNRTVFVGEQVSHHPPISSFVVKNDKEELESCANISFSIKFGTSIAITTAGPCFVRSKRFDETYELTKCIPDMWVKNAIGIGAKYIIWEGTVVLSCPKTGISASITFKESKGRTNTLKGTIMTVESPDPVYYLEGHCGQEIYTSSTEDMKNKTLFLDVRKENTVEPHYLTYNQLDRYSSVNVWKDVNKAIINDDTSLADKLKKVVEQEQRDLRKEREEKGLTHEGKYFQEVNDTWEYKGNFDLDAILQGQSDSSSKDIETSKESTPPSDEDSNSYEEAKSEVSGDRRRSRSESDVPQSKVISSDELVQSDEGLSGSTDLANLTDSEIALLRRDSSNTSVRTKKELRAEKKRVREEQKQVKNKLKLDKKNNSHSALPNTIMSGPIKMRNSLKLWKEKWFVLVPGRLIYFKTKSDVYKNNCEGMILLDGCNVRERPSKKEGFCFKVYHLMQYPIYSRQGLKGESIKRAMIPLSSDYVILLVHEEAVFQEWIKAIRSAIPDYEKIKNFMASTLGIDESESSEEMTHEDLDQATQKLDTADVKSLDTDLEMSIAQEGDSSYSLLKRVNQRSKKTVAALDDIKSLRNEFKVLQNTLIMEIRNANRNASSGLKEAPTKKSMVDKLKDNSIFVILFLLLIIFWNMWSIQSSLSYVK